MPGSKLAGAALLLLAGTASLATGPDSGEAVRIHERAIVIDAHADIADPLTHRASSTIDGGTIDEGSQVDLRKMRAGGVDAVFLSVHAPQQPRTAAGLAISRRMADAKLAAIRAIAERHLEVAAFARSAGDIRRIVAQGKIAIAAGMLNASPLGNDPEALARYHRQGVLMLGFTHAGNNDFADSSRPFARDTPGEHQGLSELGVATVRRANHLGVLLDVSQLSTPALLQTVRLSKAPVIASHSGIRGIVDNPRNLSDEELSAIAGTGGAVCIVAYSGYLRHFTDEERAPVADVVARYGGLKNGYEGMTPAEKDAFYRELAENAPQASLDDYVRSIDHVVRRIGIDHVCLSTDFNHGFGAVKGWDDASGAGNVTAALLRHGYDVTDIRKLWGENLLRVLEQAERQAEK